MRPQRLVSYAFLYTTETFRLKVSKLMFTCLEEQFEQFFPQEFQKSTLFWILIEVLFDSCSKNCYHRKCVHSLFQESVFKSCVSHKLVKMTGNSTCHSTHVSINFSKQRHRQSNDISECRGGVDKSSAEWHSRVVSSESLVSYVTIT